MGTEIFFYPESSQHESLAEKVMQQAVLRACCYFDPHMSKRQYPLDPNSPAVFNRLLIHTPEPYLHPSSEKRLVEPVLIVRMSRGQFTCSLECRQCFLLH
jgi:hypothetical protein